MERNKNIDILRGIAVITVLLGHAIQRGMIVGFQSNLLFKIIYSFHMPLFIVLSGYTFYLSNSQFNIKFLIKKLKRLVIPLVVWSYIMFFIKNFWFVGIKPFISFPDSILEYTKILILHPDYIFWFLFIIFVFQTLLCVINKLPKQYFLPIILSIIAIFWKLPVEYMGIYWLRLYFPIFVVGYYIGKYKESFISNCKYFIIPSVLIICLFFKNYLSGNNSILGTYTLSLSICLLLYFIISKINLNIFKTVFSYLGRYSLQIYLCQCLCLNIGYGTGWIRIITIFLSATSLSIIITYITNKIKILKGVLFGLF